MNNFSLSGATLYHKDARDMSEISNGTVRLVLTDPPYGRGFVSHFMPVPTKVNRPIIGDNENAPDLLADVLRECWRVMEVHSALYLFTDWKVLDKTLRVVQSVYSFKVKNVLVWVKNDWGMGDLEGSYGHSYEMIIYAVKGNPKFKGNRPRDVLFEDRVWPLDLKHPAEKPVLLLGKLIENSSDEGDLVLDPFAGSATTLEAARLLKRQAVGYEVDEHWYNIGVGRLRQGVLL